MIIESEIISYRSNTTPSLKLVSPYKPPLGAELLDDDKSGLGEFKEICWQYLHRLPLGMQLGQLKCTKEPLNNQDNFEFDSRIFYNGEMIGQIMVALYRPSQGSAEDIFLELEQSQIWYQGWRGQGLGSAIFKGVQQLGQALGVRSITAFSMDDGRFIWPYLGFKFGDYFTNEKKAQYFRKSFRAYCKRHHVIPPSTDQMYNWNAQDFARFDPGLRIPASVGHKNDRRRELVTVGRAFLLSRKPFFICYPLTSEN